MQKYSQIIKITNQKLLLSATLILLIAGVLLFTKLGKPELWDDEAHAALFGKNFAQIHAWTGWDGRNWIPDREGMFNYKDDNTVKLWQLDFLLTAVSFKIFGISTWAARLPFALCGFLCLASLYYFLRISIKKEDNYILWVLVTGALSTSYLLSCRTCRYYAVASLSIITCLFLWEMMKRSSGWIYPLLMSLSLAILCYSSILIASAFAPAFFLTMIICERKSLKTERIIKLAAIGLLVIVLVIPYIHTSVLPSLSAMSTSGYSESSLSSATERFWNHIRLLVWNVEGLDLINAIPMGVAILGISAILIRMTRATYKDEATNLFIRMSVLLALYITLLSFLSPQPVKITSIADVRYLFPVFPIIFCVVGYVFSSLWFYTKSVTVLLFIAYCCLNIYSPTFYFSQPRMLLPACVSDIFDPPQTSVGVASEFLLKEAGTNDTVWWTPHFMGKPLQYLIGDGLLLSGVATSTMPGVTRLENMRRDLIMENASPDWVVAFGLQPDLPSALKYFSDSKRVSYSLAKALNVYWGQAQRPELPWHRFGGESRFDPSTEGVYIFHKNPPAANP